MHPKPRSKVTHLLVQSGQQIIEQEGSGRSWGRVITVRTRAYRQGTDLRV